jgi:hypothetical protein
MGHYILPVVILRIEISVPTLWKHIDFEKNLVPFF